MRDEEYAELCVECALIQLKEERVWEAMRVYPMQAPHLNVHDEMEKVRENVT